MISTDELLALQQRAGRVFVHHAVVDYVVRLVVATRQPAEFGMADVAGWVSYGASPRASLGLIAAGRALALLRGRDYVLPQDVLDVAIDVLPHRMVLSYDAIADGDVRRARGRPGAADRAAAAGGAAAARHRRLPAAGERARAAAAPVHRARPAAQPGSRPTGRTPRRSRAAGRPAAGPQRRRRASPGRRRRPTAAGSAAPSRPPRPRRCCAGWSSPCATSWTACCRAATSAWCPGRAASRGSRASTTPATTCGGWTGR